MADFTPKEVDTIELADGGVTPVEKKKTTKKKAAAKEVSQVTEAPKSVALDNGVTLSLDEEKSKPIQQNVRVRFARDYRGCIGGQRYFYKKGETANVPENVKRILIREEGLLMPL